MLATIEKQLQHAIERIEQLLGPIATLQEGGSLPASAGAPQRRKKRCPSCGRVEPATTAYFYPKKGARYGLSAYCRPCMARKAQEWAKTHPERAKEIRQAYISRKRAGSHEG